MRFHSHSDSHSHSRFQIHTAARALAPMLSATLAAIACSSVTADLLPLTGGLGGWTGYGFTVRGISDLDGDGAGDVLVGAPWALGPNDSFRGTVLVYSGRTGALIRQHVGPAQFSSTEFGRAIVVLPDRDGDGVADYLIGAPQVDVPGVPQAGVVYVHSGATGALLHTQTAQIPRTHGRFGHAIALVPDYVAPGHDAVIIGEPAGAGTTPGRAYLVSIDTWLLHEVVSDPALDPSTGFAGSVAGFPDGDGDGHGDYAIGADGKGYLGFTTVGSVYVYHHDQLVNELHPTHVADEVFFGYALCGTEDMTGDGRGDLLIGSPDESVPTFRAGCVHLVSGATAQKVALLTEPTPKENAIFGYAVTTWPDRNGDGKPEWVATAPGRQDVRGIPFGRVVSAPGIWPAQVDAPPGSQSTFFGNAIASVPDMNGDGLADLVVASVDEPQPNGAGVVYLVRSLRHDDCTSLVESDATIFQGLTPINVIGATPTPNLEVNPSTCIPVSAPDVWYRHVAQCTGTLVVETCGLIDFDSMIAVYDGCATTSETCSLGAELACNDDACEAFASRVEVPVVAGQCYTIRVALYPGAAAPGTGAIRLTCQSACPYDLDASGAVDAADLAILLGVWGTDKPEADFDHSGLIDAADLALLLGAWNSCGA